MINYNMTDKEYVKLGKDTNNGFGALSYTAASRGVVSPARAVSRDPNKIIKANFGVFMHELLFTPEVIEDRYIIEDYEPARRKAIKDSGKLRINRRGKDSLDMANSMIKSIKANSTAWTWLHSTHNEVVVDYTCPETGIYIKTRLDAYKEDRGNHCIVDLKTVSENDLHDNDILRRYIEKKEYHLQAAAFTEAIKMNTNAHPNNLHYVIVFVESEPYYRDREEWHGIKVVKIDRLMYLGDELWQQRKREFAEGCANQHHKDYEDILLNF